jgi:hypothetical protein
MYHALLRACSLALGAHTARIAITYGGYQASIPRCGENMRCVVRYLDSSVQKKKEVIDARLD